MVEVVVVVEVRRVQLMLQVRGSRLLMISLLSLVCPLLRRLSILRPLRLLHPLRVRLIT